jgi:hypothetical protein
VPRTVTELKANVQRVISSVTNETLLAVTHNIRARLEMCLEREGGHIQHVLYRRL